MWKRVFVCEGSAVMCTPAAVTCMSFSSGRSVIAWPTRSTGTRPRRSLRNRLSKKQSANCLVTSNASRVFDQGGQQVPEPQGPVLRSLFQFPKRVRLRTSRGPQCVGPHGQPEHGVGRPIFAKFAATIDFFSSAGPDPTEIPHKEFQARSNHLLPG